MFLLPTDLAALYNNDASKSMGFSLPNVPWPSASGPTNSGGLSLPMNNFGTPPTGEKMSKREKF